MTIRLFMLGYQTGGPNTKVSAFVADSGGTYTGSYAVQIPPGNTDTVATFSAVALAAMLAELTSEGVPAPNAIVWLFSTDSEAFAFANPTRTLNSAFQISTARAAQVSYAVDIACALSLTTGQSGTVFLEYADDSGFTTNVVSVNQFSNANTGSLTIGLNLTQTLTGTLSGMIPEGKYVRLRTANVTSTPTFTYRTGQEVLV